MSWNPTPDFGTWQCDCGKSVSGHRHKCPECGLPDTERAHEA